MYENIKDIHNDS